MDHIRTFIAIELPNDMLKRIERILGRSQEAIPPGVVRWVRPQGIHLTLKFLGETPTDQINEIKTRLRQVGEATAPFTLNVEGMGCFPNLQRPRVIWIGIREPAGHLNRLQQQVERAIAPLGFPTEQRPFNPHLTLGRVKKGSRQALAALSNYVAKQAPTLHLGTLSVTSISLIQSELYPDGALYTPLVQVPLEGGAA